MMDMSESQNMNKNEEFQDNHTLTNPQSHISSEEELISKELDIEIELSNTHVEQDPESDLGDKGSEPSHKRKEQKDEHQSQFDALMQQFHNENNLDEKLLLAVNFMEASLSQGGTPHFRHFWEARRLCLPLFKENISSSLRSQLWSKYSELSKEARRLKDLLDEQSAFAVEQIEKAVVA